MFRTTTMRSTRTNCERDFVVKEKVVDMGWTKLDLVLCPYCRQLVAEYRTRGFVRTEPLLRTTAGNTK